MEKSEELRNFALGIYKVMEAVDIGALETIFSQADGVLAIGTDPDEWWKGHQAIVDIFGMQLKEMQGFSITSTNLGAFAEANVGWFADQFALKTADGDSIPFRLTAVCHKETGNWKVVQWHASLGVPNEEAIGQELSTG